VIDTETFQEKRNLLGTCNKAGVLTVPQRTKRVSSLQSSRELTKTNIKAMEELALTLKPIYRRMLKDGWVMKDGKLVEQV
jgi:hypothetical protein